VLDVIGAAEALPALVRTLYDPTFTVRSSAGWALVHLAQAGHSASVVEGMDTILRAARNPAPREMARLVLVNLRTPEATATLADAPDEPCLH
jgi:HEAT repeat protein